MPSPGHIPGTRRRTAWLRLGTNLPGPQGLQVPAEGEECQSILINVATSFSVSLHAYNSQCSLIMGLLWYVLDHPTVTMPGRRGSKAPNLYLFLGYKEESGMDERLLHLFLL